MDTRFKNDTHDDWPLKSASANNEVVKFVNKRIIHAYNRKVSDSQI